MTTCVHNHIKEACFICRGQKVAASKERKEAAKLMRLYNPGVSLK